LVAVVHVITPELGPKKNPKPFTTTLNLTHHPLATPPDLLAFFVVGLSIVAPFVYRGLG
jgi:hypothetical protein